MKLSTNDLGFFFYYLFCACSFVFFLPITEGFELEHHEQLRSSRIAEELSPVEGSSTCTRSEPGLSGAACRPTHSGVEPLARHTGKATFGQTCLSNSKTSVMEGSHLMRWFDTSDVLNAVL